LVRNDFIFLEECLFFIGFSLLPTSFQIAPCTGLAQNEKKLVFSLANE
jgi:hypothetical protein